ncbi:restriction endonuclease [Cytobacillus dafuensis]|uniref:Restriction endonuclease type IV Mrr domain-containing protein n=1 Tax=Cytobacillus dafuensis TaxID=1742359 RepID=A0A5B8Z1T4_CYTDA|nr:restriction endonuclease [Cytobacillus dafuensis]QED46982.1 hypothetical protein FSZ17_06810 [Cytobacillus dafuensis]
MPKYRCVKHQKIMNEKIENNKIQPYCVDCRTEELYREKLQDYTYNETRYMKEHKRIVRNERFSKVFESSFTVLFYFIILSFIIGSLLEGFFSLEIGAFTGILFCLGLSFLVFIYLIVKFDEPTTIFSEPTEEIIRDIVIVEKEHNEKAVENYKNKLQKEYAVKSTRIDEVDNMKGLEFEHFVAELLWNIGYMNVRVTKGSGDFGVDIIATNIKGEKTAIQCKRYKGKVGYDAIQQILAGKTKEKCKKGMVITNSYFTKPAFEASKEFGIELWSRKRLIEEMQKYEPRFTWEEFLNSYYTKPKGKPSYKNRVLVP